jgi:FKBP-type peptidyl-prolyl cis-trans isomerase
MLVLMLGLAAMIGCQGDSDSADVTEQTETAVAEETEAVVAEETETAVAEEVEAVVAEEPLNTADIPNDLENIVIKESGVRYQELVVGTGVEAADRMKVGCHYTLWFADSTGLEKVSRYQSSKDGESYPFQCQLGVRLIPGWSEGMIGMKEGGTRRIFIPWRLGYGDARSGKIPARTNLVFEIDFLEAI